MRFKNLVLIGTSHIASQSLKEVEEGIEREKPGIIALELDKRRFLSLMSAEKKRPGIGLIRTIGITGYLFSLIGGWLQEKDRCCFDRPGHRHHDEKALQDVQLEGKAQARH